MKQYSAYTLGGQSMELIATISTGLDGTFSNDPNVWVGIFPISSTWSKPTITFPNTAYPFWLSPSNDGLSASEMKNRIASIYSQKVVWI